MRRKNAVAGVYMFTEKATNKVYIGESQDLHVRYNDYLRLSNDAEKLKAKNKKYFLGSRPIEVAICENGIDAFDYKVLIDEFEDEDLTDTKYRKAMETYFIKKTHADDPNKGFNRPGKYLTFFDLYKTRKISFHNLHKANPLLLYNFKDDSVMMFLSASSCGHYIDKDKGIVARCLKTGNATDWYLCYYVDINLRIGAAVESIARKLGATGSYSMKSKNGEQLAIRYISGLRRVNEWCDQYGYDQMSFDIIYDILGFKFNIDNKQLDYLFTSSK